MSHWRVILFLGLLTGTITAQVIGQGLPRPGGRAAAGPTPPSPGSLLRPPPLARTPDEGGAGAATGTGLASPDARTFLNQAQSLIGSGRLAEAREALRTALRLEPMNLEAWNLYDYATELAYIERARDEKRNPVIERDLQPLFSIERVESYEEFGTLYLVGEIRNVSGGLRQNILVQGVLLDENKQELRRETGVLPLKDRGLFPNESSLFEIPFRNPPPGVKSYRVRVAGFD
ncbi:MAG: hypothetical protein OZSIB_1390 [Candidatus Ozemobacter sibiricus]|jgi:tetratricopeptide (TPR) repeat protein|uniref:Uncharacterized protein n=1 Tax=Candidatus Ozemobacter sibiricus TaxID=2268124 RepID=A0A367ZKA4_9BACT|nr:MAG: hypothetical protein OZSIB_1390 [Candidatus Ozemobacter sibiricus]